MSEVFWFVPPDPSRWQRLVDRFRAWRFRHRIGRSRRWQDMGAVQADGDEDDR